MFAAAKYFVVEMPSFLALSTLIYEMSSMLCSGYLDWRRFDVDTLVFCLRLVVNVLPIFFCKVVWPEEVFIPGLPAGAV